LEIASLKAENEQLTMRLLLFKCKDCPEGITAFFNAEAEKAEIAALKAENEKL